MNILISNDDGVGLDGIKVLSRELSKKHNVYVVAPDTQKSATSQALTIHSPLRVRELSTVEFGAERVWSVTGTPADCVKLGLSTILSEDELPDIIISGINHGPNLGHDVRYSGTVGAALEGAMLGYPAIAVSLAAIKSEVKDFIYPAKFISEFLDSYQPYNSQITLNINFPLSASRDSEVVVTQLAQRIFSSCYEKRVDPQGREYYWLAGKLVDDVQEQVTDLDAIRNGKISITPLNYDMTSFDGINEIRQSYSGELINH